MNDDNPLAGGSPETYDEAHFVDEQADALFDVYVMLRDYGFESTDLGPLACAITYLTIYTSADVERAYQSGSGDDES